MSLTGRGPRRLGVIRRFCVRSCSGQDARFLNDVALSANFTSAGNVT
jgi:hypothetical protein